MKNQNGNTFPRFSQIKPPLNKIVCLFICLFVYLFFVLSFALIIFLCAQVVNGDSQENIEKDVVT